MSLLTYNELKALVDSGAIENVQPDDINGASIDLRMGDGYYIEAEPFGYDSKYIDLSQKETPRMIKANGTLVIPPGGFALASTEQVFHLPDDVAGHYMLKSSLARAGLNHLFAGWADPTWHSSVLTLELHNTLKHHSLVLKPGCKVGQMVFWRGQPVPEEKSYAVRGQYNADSGVQASRGVR